MLEVTPVFALFPLFEDCIENNHICEQKIVTLMEIGYQQY